MRHGASLPFAFSSMALLFVGCTFGLGEYAVRGSDALDPEIDASDASSGGVTDGTSSGSIGSDEDAAPAGGPCSDGTKPRACTPEGDDAGDGGDSGDPDNAFCEGTQKCVIGKWSSCAVERSCPANWTDSTPSRCRQVQLIGDAPLPRWTQTPAQGAPKEWWKVRRALPFDIYSQNDQLCFRPMDFGNCVTTTTTAFEVRCNSGSGLKLNGNQFFDGSVHGKRFCVDYSGDECTFVDRSHLVWDGNAGPACERWVVDAAFVVEAAPRCKPW